MSFKYSARTDIYWTKYPTKFGFLGRGYDPYGDRSIPAIHTNPLRLANGSVVYSLDLDPPAEDRVIVATIREAELL